MFCANHALESEWSVSILNGNPVVKHYTEQKDDSLPFTLTAKPPFIGNRVVLAVSDGFLVGFDKGEFGGGLWWFSKNGKDRYVISDENIKSLASIAGSIVAVAGLAHMGTNRGKVFELDRDGNKWTILRSLDLNAAPCATVKSDGNKFIIVTTKGVSVYNEGFVSKILSSNYSLLYPNSVVVTQDGTILVGMRYAVAKIFQKDGLYIESWLVKRGCESLKEISGRCECVSKER